MAAEFSAEPPEQAPTANRGRVYPVSPPGGDDARFSKGLVIEVAAVLQRHGYPGPNDLQAGDWVELQQALFRFLYGGA